MNSFVISKLKNHFMMKKTTLFFTFLMGLTFGYAQITVVTTTGSIPDASPAGIDFNGNAVSALNSITDVTLDLDINHPWNGDLIVTLTSPEGTAIILVDRPGRITSAPGCNENGMRITLDDMSAIPIEDCTGENGPYPAVIGSYYPNNPLSDFEGEDPNGIWILNISDNLGGDSGDLIAATINIMGETLGLVQNEIIGFNLYPNPVSSTLTIEAPKTIEIVNIFNMLGQEIMRSTPNAISSTLDMSDLQSGVYIINLTIEGVALTRRLVKE